MPIIKRFKDILVGEKFRIAERAFRNNTLYTKTAPVKITKRHIKQDSLLTGDEGMISEATYVYLNAPHRAFLRNQNMLCELVRKNGTLDEVYTRDWIHVCKNAMSLAMREFKANSNDRTESDLLGAIATYREACIKYDQQGNGNRKAWKGGN